MSDLTPALPAELLNPQSGEMLPATAENAALVLAVIRDMRSRLLDYVKDCEAVLVEESRRLGTKTLRLGDMTAEITGGSRVVWDIEALEKALAEAGCPPERVDELIQVTVERKVNQAVARQLAGANVAYAAAIEAAKGREPAAIRVSVKGGA